MVNHLYDIILTCGILVNGISGLDDGLTYERYTNESNHQTATASRTDLIINCISIGSQALKNDVENPDFILVSALHESKFAPNAVGIGQNGLPLKDRRGHFLYHGALQVTPMWTCPDAMGVPHGTWKENRLDYNGVCNPELAGILFFRKLKKKHRKNDKAVFCEYKKGHPCTAQDFLVPKNMRFVENRMGALSSLRKRLKKFKQNPQLVRTEMHLEVALLLIPLLSIQPTLVSLSESLKESQLWQ
jgi:hypothetical protein